MFHYDTLIRNVKILDGTGRDATFGSVAIKDHVIERMGNLDGTSADQTIEGDGKVLAPGFIDSHSHDDLYAIRAPDMLPKLSQGVTTVIVGNCGISASPVTLHRDPPSPMNLLGSPTAFRYPKFADYVAALNAAQPAVNVAALVGHTSLRNNWMDRLDCVATSAEIDNMRAQLDEALDCGALGLSTGLAYSSANSAPTEEVTAVAEPLFRAGGIYATHLRTEGDRVLGALNEAFEIGKNSKVPVIVSHLKCAGVNNWNRSGELLSVLEDAGTGSTIGWDCYPYAASSTVLDLKQVDERLTIMVTWSTGYPEMAGKTLAEIAEGWGLGQIEAAKKLQPAGAIYHCLSEEDVRRILAHPGTMIGSDGLPNDAFPHPRLWGTFPRVLAHYSREQKLFSLSEAVRKMTSLPAQRFGMADRGLVKEGCPADLVLFDPEVVHDNASFSDPVRAAAGIDAVWVNGKLSYREGSSTGQRAGRFLRHKS
jgi:N-acyl-D-amino-acid deacylase